MGLNPVKSRLPGVFYADFEALKFLDFDRCVSNKIARTDEKTV